MISGHETTSGTLSFLFYNLLKHPDAYQAAQREVDEVIGRGPVIVDHMSKLPFIEACLRETLRLNPPVFAFAIQPLPETTEYPVIIGGKYQVHKGDVLIPLLPKLHRDPTVYGEDAEVFKPERMLDEPFSKLPPNSWKVSTKCESLYRHSS
jgi:cytochrome P450/NADPH-cytochrome P450 reductase